MASLASSSRPCSYSWCAMLSVQALSRNSGAEPKIAPPGIKEVQVPFASLKPEATFKIGEDADWVEITDDAVWVASSKPASVHRIDPKNNKEVAVIPVPGDPCAGLAFAFGSLWVPLCGKPNSLARVDASANRIVRFFPSGRPAKRVESQPALTASGSSAMTPVPSPASIRPQTSSAKRFQSHGVLQSKLQRRRGLDHQRDRKSVDCRQRNNGQRHGHNPSRAQAAISDGWCRFDLDSEPGDGTVTRIEARSKKVTATITVGIPGHGGDIAWGAGFIWATLLNMPLTAIDPKTNKVVRQWIGPGGDSLRFGHDSIWLTDYKQGTLSRIAYRETLKSKVSQ